MADEGRERAGDMIANATGNALALEQIAYRQADIIARLRRELEEARVRADLWQGRAMEHATKWLRNRWAKLDEMTAAREADLE